MAGLQVRHLKKSFDRTTVIDDVSFEVEEGQFCILLGPSGCGKSTILRLIAGLERQDEGEIYSGGREISELTPRERDVAMVFQSYALYPHFNVYENMAFSLRMKRVSRQTIREKVTAAAKLLGIEELLGRKPSELSGGQRQRVAIGRAIVRNPRLFLFDEPLSNLDANLRATMRIELAKLYRELGTTTLYVTHDQIEAMTLGEKIVLLHRGKVQQIGSPREVYDRPENLFAATFIGSPQINLIEGALSGAGAGMRFESSALSLDLGPVENLKPYAGAAVTIGVRPEALSPGEGPLRGEIELLEHVGSETILYVRAGETRITAKARANFNARIGDPVSLAVNPAEMLFFRRGTRIG